MMTATIPNKQGGRAGHAFLIPVSSTTVAAAGAACTPQQQTVQALARATHLQLATAYHATGAESVILGGRGARAVTRGQCGVFTPNRRYNNNNTIVATAVPPPKKRTYHKASKRAAVATPRPPPVPRTPKKRSRLQLKSPVRSGSCSPMSSASGSSSCGYSSEDSDYYGEDDDGGALQLARHSEVEKGRRIHLRKSFENLRKKIPGIEHDEKIPKAKILRRAAEYCRELATINEEDVAEISRLKNLQNDFVWRTENRRAMLELDQGDM